MKDDISNFDIRQVIERIADAHIDMSCLDENHNGWTVIEGKLFKVIFKTGNLSKAYKSLSAQIPEEFEVGKPYTIRPDSERWFETPIESIDWRVDSDGIIEFYCDPETRRTLVRSNVYEEVHGAHD